MCPLMFDVFYHRRSFFQSVCTLGYCLVPLTISLIISRILLIFASITFRLVFTLKVVIVSTSLVWSVWGECSPLSYHSQLFIFPASPLLPPPSPLPPPSSLLPRSITWFPIELSPSRPKGLGHLSYCSVLFQYQFAHTVATQYILIEHFFFFNPHTF